MLDPASDRAADVERLDLAGSGGGIDHERPVEFAGHVQVDRRAATGDRVAERLSVGAVEVIVPMRR